MLVFFTAALPFDPCGGGGFTPDGKSIISPVRPRGRGGGGCRLGSVGLSDDVEDVVLTVVGLLVGGGVIGRGMRRADEVGGDGDGDGGRGRALRDFRGGEIGFVVGFVRERGTEKERDLKIM